MCAVGVGQMSDSKILVVHSGVVSFLCVLLNEKMGSMLEENMEGSNKLKRFRIFLAAQAQRTDRLVSTNTELMDMLFSVVQRTVSMIRPFFQAWLEEEQERVEEESRTDGELLEKSDFNKFLYDQIMTEMLDNIDRYESVDEVIAENNMVVLNLK